MSLLEWKDEYSLGVTAMDNDHKGLVAAMNRVHELACGGADRDQIDGSIRSLLDLTKAHFAAEERHMEAIDFPGFRRHKLIHNDMLRRVAEHHEAFLAGAGTVDPSFFEFLVHWLGAHICHIDRKYAQHPVPAEH